MPSTVEFLEDQEIIKIDSYGRSSIEDWNNSLDQVLKLNAKTMVSRVLIDTRRQESSPGTLHLFNFAAGLPIALKFALVVSEMTRTDLDFLETVGKNRGKSIQLFDDYAQALDWLEPKK